MFVTVLISVPLAGKLSDVVAVDVNVLVNAPANVTLAAVVMVLDPLLTPVPPLDGGIVDNHVGTPVDPPDDKMLPEDPYAPLNARDPVAFRVIASVVPLLTMKWIALDPYVPIAKSVDADAKYVHPAVLNPEPTNPDELIPNSP
jgi:hypothetical protein